MKARHSVHRQRGVVMFVAIIVLIVMTLAGLAMLRQIGGGASIAGNLAFKQNATSVADLGSEAARAWIIANPNLLVLTAPASGYYSNWGVSADPTTYDWNDTGSKLVTTDDGTGNEVRYVIHQLCERENTPANDVTQHCSNAGPGVPSDKGGGSYGSPPPPTPPAPLYRITTQVKGPRNTLSYTQIVMN